MNTSLLTSTLLPTVFLLVYSEWGFGSEVPVRSLAVDVIILRDGTRLRGAARVPVTEDSVTLLMRGSWLRQHYPELLVIQEDDVTNTATETIQALKAHLKSRDRETEKERERTGYLNEQIERLQNEPITEPDLILLHIPAGRIRRRFIQTSARKSVAFKAILNLVDGAEAISTEQLRKRLAAIPAEELIAELPSESTPELMSVAQKVLLQSDRIFGKVSKLIRHGRTFVSEFAAEHDVSKVAFEILADTLQQEMLQLLTEEPPPTGQQNLSHAVSLDTRLDAAAETIANKEDADIVELTSMRLDAVHGNASVTIEVYQRRANMQWHRATRVSKTAGTNDVEEEHKQRIRNDPRVQQVLQVFVSIGTGQQISHAVSIGAVVAVAQQRARAALDAKLATVQRSPSLREYTLAGN